MLFIKIIRRILLITFVILSAQHAISQNTQFRIYNQEAMRPSVPQGFRLVTNVEPRLSYQDILDGLSSENYEKRENAALKLYKERKGHSYSFDLLIPLLKDNSELVTQYISSTILDIINKNPSTSRSLQGYFKDIYAILESSSDPYVRANCIALLSWATDDFKKIENLIVSSLEKGSRYEIINSTIAVSHFSPNSIEIYRILANQISNKSYDNKIIAEAMVNIALEFRFNNEGYNANRLLDGNSILKAVNSQNLNEEISAIEDIALSIKSKANNRRDSLVATSGKIFQVSDEFDWSWTGNSTITLNGKNVFISSNKKSNFIKFMGEDTGLIEGLNIIDSLHIKYTVWMEDSILRSFENPYKKSYAVLVAIDQYSNTGYENLGNMVDKALTLQNALVKQGFREKNIFQLYNKDATSSAITNLLKEFWQGGQYSDADRLIFYFGGHGGYIERKGAKGDNSNQTGFLVTSDHVKARPTASSLLMKELTGSHFENIVSNHVLMLIDSCSSGLALPRFQSSDKDIKTVNKFKKYVVIESEIKRPARNIIVAGTGVQKALWENGGIFTTSLIKGLSGEADFNKDGIIEFDELSLYLKNNVRAKAASTGVDQEPRSFKANKYGEGSVIFLGV